MMDFWAANVSENHQDALLRARILKDLAETMRLFDDIEPDETPEHVQELQSHFAFVNDNKVGRDTSEIRAKCEYWFERIPEAKRPGLRKRFRSRRDDQHDGAFFELLLHELFLRLDCEVEFEPHVGELTPDFRVSQGEISIYVDATSVGLTSNPFHPSRNEQEVIDTLNTLSSPHFSLWIDVDGKLQRTIPKRELAGRVERLLNDYDPEEVRARIAKFGRHETPFEEIKYADWTLTIWLVPTPEDGSLTNSERPIVKGRYRAKWIDRISSVREALREKAKKYGELHAPLVIAVNALNPFYSPEECDADVLWGDLCVQYELGANDRTLYVRQSNGFWSSERGSRTAGVLSVQKADMLNMSQAAGRLHVNPGNDSPAMPDALFRLPHCVISHGDIARRAGENVAQLLGLNLK